MPRAAAETLNPDQYTAYDQSRGMNWPKTKPAEILNFPRMGPLMGITHRKKILFKAKRKTYVFTVVIHGAYNAMGLIGSECNGIGVLDERAREVVLDQHLRQASGYFGPSQAQIDEWERVCGLPYDEFSAFVNSNSRARVQL